MIEREEGEARPFTPSGKPLPLAVRPPGAAVPAGGTGSARRWTNGAETAWFPSAVAIMARTYVRLAICVRGYAMLVPPRRPDDHHPRSRSAREHR